jgi:hypothetical protein
MAMYRSTKINQSPRRLVIGRLVTGLASWRATKQSRRHAYTGCAKCRHRQSTRRCGNWEPVVVVVLASSVHVPPLAATRRVLLLFMFLVMLVE